MSGRRFPGAGLRALAALVILAAATVAVPASAQTYAALVMDARTGEVLHARNADQRLHPASLTKMMTLYLAIEAVKDGRLSLDQRVRVSAHAASQPPSRMGLRAGQTATVRDLMRASAVRSANDAATALAEATVGGTVEQWSRLATQRAQALGMTNTTFRNPHGLTQQGHLSTARDMAILGRRLFFDHPEYYNLFSRTSTTAMGRTINTTNRRLLEHYRGADGIKTGYTRAAGFNLVASAQRDGRHVIASVFGGRSAVDRNDKVVELLELGFARSPRFAQVIPPSAVPTRLAAAPVPAERPGAPRSLLDRVGDALTPSAAAAVPSRSASRMAPQSAALPAPRPGSQSLRLAGKGGEQVAASLPPARPGRR